MAACQSLSLVVSVRIRLPHPYLGDVMSIVKTFFAHILAAIIMMTLFDIGMFLYRKIKKALLVIADKKRS